MKPEPIAAPERLTSAHDASRFRCGEPSLDDRLRRRALVNEESGASRTYVVCAARRRIVGYYALATGAVDRDFHGRRIGSALLRDAILRTLQAADIAGVRAILVHALSETARQFYADRGFIPSPIDPMTLMLPLAEARIAFTLTPPPREK